MLRKMLIAVMAVVVLGVGSTAMARSGGGGHGGSFAGGHGGSFVGGHGGSFVGGHGGSFGGGAMRGAGIGHPVHGGGVVGAPMVSGRVQGFSGRPLNRNSFAFNGGFRDHRHHHRFHNRNVFAFGFAGPYFDDYGYYDDCWRRVRTYYGWRWANVCGGYPYWSY